MDRQRVTSRPWISNPVAEDKNSVKELFAVLKLTYPHFMKDQDTVPAMRLWHQHLSDFSVEQIQAAAVAVIDHHPTFPPTIGEFKKLVASSRVRPGGLAIEMAPICPKCRSVRNSQRHKDECGEVK